MNRAFFKSASVLLVAVLLLVTPFTSAFAAQTGDALAAQPNASITKGAFAALINESFSFESTGTENFLDVPADHPYAADLLCAKENGYMVGDDTGKVHPDATISGAEAAVLVNNLLGFDPAKAPQMDGLSTPAWATQSAAILLDLTLLNNSLLSKSVLTVSDALALIQALAVAKQYSGSPYALAQQTLEEDYYAYTNRQYLATATVAPGNLFATPFSDVSVVVQNQISTILSDILASSNLKEGSEEWKIKEIFNMYMDTEKRSGSLPKLQPYFDEINAIKTIDEFLAYADNNSSLNFFYSIISLNDAKVDASKWSAILVSGNLDLGSKDYYGDAAELQPIQQAYRDYLGKILTYIGETENIDARVKAIYAIEKGRAEKDLPAGSYQDPNVLYAPTTWAAIEKLNLPLGTDELTKALKKLNVYCPNMEYMSYAAGLYSQENLQALKDYALLRVFSAYSSALGEDASEMGNDLVQALYGQVPEKTSLAVSAQLFVTNMMSDSFSQLYAKKYCSPQTKNDVTGMVESIRGKYRERIEANTWMSAQTKKEAIAKLNAIKAYVAYPDDDVLSYGYEVKPIKEGGDLIDVLTSIYTTQAEVSLDLLSKPANTIVWENLPTYTVNAYYSPTNNAIMIPAGILQAPFYGVGREDEENLGGIGAVIAHEFTHAFDNSGAQYDKNGTITSWWTTEDFAAFNKLTGKVAADLSKIEFLEGVYVNGVLCTGETVADLGAVACVLDITDDQADGDLGKIMETWSSIWASRMTPEITAYLISLDSHAPNKVRVNFILSNTDLFYQIYNITAEDGMYLSEAERISIW